ncbi:MAG: trehalose-phosphatase [Chloroflexi bacterium]|nr:trehalose-phosphatase [Chloroflexota bacterium]
MTESSQETDASLSRALTLARDALAQPPAGLLTDFDGTLSAIVTEPSAARLVDGAQGALATLAERLAVVAIITGRAPLEALRLTAVPGLLIAGNHGMEWLEPAAHEPVAGPEAASVSRRLDEVLARLPDLPGVVPEHKGISASVHYRSAPDPAAARDAILAALGNVEEHGLRINHGRMIVEIRPVGLGDKGTAVRIIVERFALRGVVVMGDDVTDLDMFRAVAELRDAGRVRGAIIGVGEADHEVRPEIAAAADAMVADPPAAARFLAGLSAPA